MTTLNLTVPDMACAACADTITKAVKSLDSNASIQADPKTKQVAVATTQNPEQIKQAIANAGYTVQT
ncbi:MAG: heavy-metal-associated domain-containing protein [Cyanobacteria bacterium J06639_14]